MTGRAFDLEQYDADREDEAFGETLDEVPGLYGPVTGFTSSARTDWNPARGSLGPDGHSAERPVNGPGGALSSRAAGPSPATHT